MAKKTPAAGPAGITVRKWDRFARQAQGVGGPSTQQVVEWAAALDPEEMHQYARFAYCEVDLLFACPSQEVFRRLYQVQCLFALCGYRSGAEALSVYLQAYSLRQMRWGEG